MISRVASGIRRNRFHFQVRDDIVLECLDGDDSKYKFSNIHAFNLRSTVKLKSLYDYTVKDFPLVILEGAMFLDKVPLDTSSGSKPIHVPIPDDIQQIPYIISALEKMKVLTLNFWDNRGDEDRWETYKYLDNIRRNVEYYLELVCWYGLKHHRGDVHIIKVRSLIKDISENLWGDDRLYDMVKYHGYFYQTERYIKDNDKGE